MTETSLYSGYEFEPLVGAEIDVMNLRSYRVPVIRQKELLKDMIAWALENGDTQYAHNLQQFLDKIER